MGSLNRSTDMQAWRAACEARFEPIIDAIFDHSRQYHVFQEPDPVRPLVDQGVRSLMDDLFDPSHYPQGMTYDAVLKRADQEWVPHMERVFEPHQETMLVPSKINFKPGPSMGYEDMDRTMALYGEYLIGQMQEAALALGASVPNEDLGYHTRKLAEEYGAPKSRGR